jgi:hypothetical protein
MELRRTLNDLIDRELALFDEDEVIVEKEKNGGKKVGVIIDNSVVDAEVILNKEKEKKNEWK